MPQLNFEYKNLIGISRQKDTNRIPVGYVAYAMNVDSDDEKKLRRRRGLTSVSTVNTHSVWSNRDICLCVQGGVLKEVTINLVTNTATYVTLLSGAGDTPMIFREAGDMVFFSNSDVFGYIREHAVHGISEVSETFKVRMVGGHLMEYWDSRLWVFQDNILIYSDATEPMVRDERHNFVTFNGRGRMLEAVRDGIYVSDNERCGFLQGGAGDPPKFNYTEVCPSPCIEGMAVSSVEQLAGISVKVVFWVTEEGCYMGLPGGQVNKVTGDHFYIEGASIGRMMVLNRSFPDHTSIDQLLGTYDLWPGYGGMEIELDVPATDVDGRITAA